MARLNYRLHRRCVGCRPDPIEEIKSERDRAFDQAMTVLKPDLELAAKSKLSRLQRTEIEYAAIRGYIRDRMEPPTSESQEVAIEHACRELKVSDGTARAALTAWSWVKLVEQAEKRKRKRKPVATKR
jgi:hypothetical protein